MRGIRSYSTRKFHQWSAAVAAMVARYRAVFDSDVGTIRDTAARLQLALDASNLGTFVWHIETDTIEPDARTRKLLGLSEHHTHTLSTKLGGAIHPGDRARYDEAVHGATGPSGPGTFRAEFRVVHGDGSVHWLEMIARRVSDDSRREDTRMAGTLADVTERERLAQALRDREERLRAADRRTDEFVAVLAHELRNPLGPIRTGLELVRIAGGDVAALGHAQQMMERQVDHLVRLVDDLLDTARITSGKLRLQRRPTPLSTMVETAVDASRSAIDHKGITLRVSLPDAPVVVDVDPTRFIQIISNLLTNAVKFTDASGRIELSAHVAQSSLCLTLTDTGIGISRELLPRLFDLFTQGEVALHRGCGLGIGLALVRQLVEMHGGSIEARSPGIGRGSTFTIRVPLAPGSAAVGVAEHPSPCAAATVRTLVVDDNTDAAESLKTFLASLGCECRVAYDGEHGVRAARDFQPHVVLLDLGMPRVDGYEACRRIRGQVGSSVKIIALSGWGQDGDRCAARRAGFDLHMSKPVDPTVLKQLLADLDSEPTRGSVGEAGECEPDGQRRNHMNPESSGAMSLAHEARRKRIRSPGDEPRVQSARLSSSPFLAVLLARLAGEA